MENKMGKKIVQGSLVILALIFSVWVLYIAVDKEAKIYCEKIKSQQIEFGVAYENWKKENADRHLSDVIFCKEYGIEISL
jgi:hypothetical protein